MDRITLVIPTRNRLGELKITLQSLSGTLSNERVLCIICDDGSQDGTFNYITRHYPRIKLIRNHSPQGIHHVRNQLLSLVETEFVLSIDDDANFITTLDFKSILAYMDENPNVALLYFRTFWDANPPEILEYDNTIIRTQSFVAVSFLLKMSAWSEIPEFPTWFKFYGEEDFASYHFFKADFEIHYFPSVLVHHRVNVTKRRTDADYYLRLRRSLRSGWYLYLLFCPWSMIPRKLAYTYCMQIKLKVIGGGGKGNLKSLLSINRALIDVFINLPRLVKQSNRFSIEEQKEYTSLNKPVIYWTPGIKNN